MTRLHTARVLSAALLLLAIGVRGDCAETGARQPEVKVSGENSSNPTRKDGGETCRGYDSAWESFSKQGETALKGGRFGDAERKFNSALKEAQKSGKPDLRLAESYENLAALYQARGQFARSEPLLERAMSARGHSLGVEDPAVLISLAKLGQFYLAHAKAVKAERLYGKLIEFTDRKLHQEQRAVSDLTELATFFLTRPEFGGASDLIKRVQKITAGALNEQYPELAVGLDRLGSTYLQKSKLLQAEELFKRALAIREKSLTADHLALATSYENLASVYLAQGKFALAEPLFKKSLEISEKVVGTQRADTFSKVDGLAQCYANLGQHSDAEAMYQRIVDNADKAGTSNSLNVGRCLIGLAQIYKQQGKYAQAEPLLKRALSITEKVNGPQHWSLTSILDAYAEILQKTNRNAEAARYLARSRAIRGT